MKASAPKSGPEPQQPHGHRNRPASHPFATRASSFVDNRPQAIAQRKRHIETGQPSSHRHLAQLQAMMNASPRAQSTSWLQAVIDGGPRQVTQRRQLQGMFGPSVQRKEDPQEEELIQGRLPPLQRQEIEEEELLQGKYAVDPATTQPATRSQPTGASAQNRTGMPDALKTGLETLSGMDLSAVRVHHDSDKPARVGALAYAQGQNIHLAPGQERHLAHEAWHVVQQMQGRVKPTLQTKGVSINDDQALEREADRMGDKALRVTSAHAAAIGPALPTVSQDRVVQAKIGFELELLTLVDVAGRPPPEKSFLGSYGAEHLELQVDQNASVEGRTPRAPAEANFSVARRLPTPDDADPHWRTFGAYDLPTGEGWQSAVGATQHGAAGDPRAGLAYRLLRNSTWQRRTAANAFTRPPGANDAGLDNTDLPAIDAAIARFGSARTNWESERARALCATVILHAEAWLAANNAPPNAGGLNMSARLRRRRYRAATATIQALRNEAQQHRNFWANPANAQPPAGWERVYRQAAGARGQRAWSPEHPIAGAGTDHYASILEIVTRPYAPETPAGRADLVTAMTEASTLAAAIEAATGGFANRVRLDAIAGTSVLNAETHVGNSQATRSPQSTDASIQSTFAIDLTQIGSLMKSIAGLGAPQKRVSLKHQADVGASATAPGGINRAEREMVLAVRDATLAINDLKANVGAGAPSFVNLRGVVILMCQYLRLGKYWTGPDIASPLDKNLTDLLSRTNLAHVYRGLVPAAEKAWLGAAPHNMTWFENRILHHAGRVPGSALLNQPTEDRPAEGGGQFSITCRRFVDNVLTTGDDGVTGHWGGFQQRPAEDIDPAGAHRGADTRPAGAAHRMAPVFEMRNMVPKLGGADRFPRADWVPLAIYLSRAIELLNQRNEAAATGDVRIRDTAAGVNLNPPEAAW